MRKNWPAGGESLLKTDTVDNYQGCRNVRRARGGSFFKGHFQYCTYRHYHQHYRHTVKQLNTSPKPENRIRCINTKKSLQTNYQLNKGRFYCRMPLGVWGRRPNSRRQGGLGRSSQRSEILQFLCKNNLILDLL